MDREIQVCMHRVILPPTWAAFRHTCQHMDSGTLFLYTHLAQTHNPTHIRGVNVCVYTSKTDMHTQHTKKAPTDVCVYTRA